MKRVTVILALVLASVALVACGGGDDNSGTTTSTTTSGAESTSQESASGAESTSQESADGEGPEEEALGGADSVIGFETDPNGQLAYTTKYVSATPGKDTIELKNPQSLPHDVRIESEGKDLGGTETIADSSTSATINLKPGSYTYYCSVPGHREAGMEGTLTVIRG